MNFNAENKTVQLRNRYAFLDLNTFNLKWVLLRNGEAIQEGITTALNGQPNAIISASVPYNSDLIDNQHEFLLSVFIITKEASDWADVGHAVASEQFQITATPSLKAVDISKVEGTLEESVSDVEITFTGNNFSISFNKTNGVLSSLIYDGIETIYSKGGFEFDPTDTLKMMDHRFPPYYNVLESAEFNYTVADDKNQLH